MKYDTIRKAVADVSAHLGFRYCTGCMKDKPAGEFIRRTTRSGTRWICGTCQQKRSESWITRGKAK